MEAILINPKIIIRISSNILILFLLTSCLSEYYTKFYSHPEVKSEVPAQVNHHYKYHFQKLFARQMPSVFADSICHSLIKVKLDNDCERDIIGPIVPLIPIWTGYGFDTGKFVMLKKNRSATNLTLHLSIYIGKSDTISFNPALFLIRKTSTKGDKIEAKAVFFSDANGYYELKEYRYIGNPQKILLFAIVFEPEVYVEDRPLLLLNSLCINNQNFYLEGILFKRGKKSYYIPLIPING